MIAILFALPEESQSLTGLLENARRSGSRALPVWTGKLSGRKVTVAHTGAGMERARDTGAEIARSGRFSVVVSSGFAGALDPALGIGDLILAENYSTPDLLGLARGCSPAAVSGRLETVSAVVERAAEKRALFEKSGAIAVDMETAALHEACRAAGIPFLSVRAISDEAGQDLPVPFPVWFDSERQRPRVGTLLGYLALHPGKIGPFARFVKGVSVARASLTTHLRNLIGELPAGD